ncbi:MAG: hypothetical protein ABR863_05315 [Roseiarcus sp.]|jgi:hypothetical protein
MKKAAANLSFFDAAYAAAAGSSNRELFNAMLIDGLSIPSARRRPLRDRSSLARR